jgi:hypothetical protein
MDFQGRRSLRTLRHSTLEKASVTSTSSLRAGICYAKPEQAVTWPMDSGRRRFLSNLTHLTLEKAVNLTCICSFRFLHVVKVREIIQSLAIAARAAPPGASVEILLCLPQQDQAGAAVRWEFVLAHQGPCWRKGATNSARRGKKYFLSSRCRNGGEGAAALTARSSPCF